MISEQGRCMTTPARAIFMGIDMLPEGAPERLGDRVVLWNEVRQV